MVQCGVGESKVYVAVGNLMSWGGEEVAGVEVKVVHGPGCLGGLFCACGCLGGSGSSDGRASEHQ